jgi:hypothetical protein
MLTNFIAVTAGLATTASAFTCTGNYFSFFNRGNGDSLTYARMDPSLYPGTVSPHLHSFDGANGLASTTTYKGLMDSTCTTARVKSDKSLYWRPSLFWNGNGTGNYRVPETASKIYYKYGDADKWANVTGFPEDFNMIAGQPTKRADGDNPAGVRWACHQPDGRDDKIFTNGFPKGFQSCAYGFASEVTFPSCWNGQKTDPKDPHAHMAYPTGAGGVGIENCPTTHRAARFPTIFIEFWYDISSFNGQYAASSSPWVLSNGDNTGYGFHGDFMNGWEKGVLEKATQETGGCNCGCGCGQTEMETCFGAENVNKNDDPEFLKCGVMAASSAEAAKKLDTLPGCNPIQSGPASATAVTGPACSATYAAGAGGDASAVSKIPAASASAAASAYASASASASAAKSASASAYASASAAASASAKASSSAGSSSAIKDDAYPSLAISIPIKQVASAKPAAAESYGAPASSAAMATASAVKPALPSLSLAAPSSVVTGNPSAADCSAPIYITVTPTVYITVGANATASCTSSGVTVTLTQTATVTVPAMYGSY